MPAQGFVQAHVYTSRANLPIQNAAVSFYRTSPNSAPELIAFRTTDSSGNTPPIAIPTPDLSASRDPQHPGGFSTITISVDEPEYERVLVEDVQVFPGITTQQDVQLIPRETLVTERDWSEDIKITPQPL